MKKILSLVLAMVLVLSVMTGCGKKSDPQNTPAQGGTNTEATAPSGENKPGDVVVPGETKPEDKGGETSPEGKKDETKPEGKDDNKPTIDNPNLIKGDDIQWPQDKMGSLKPIDNSKLYSINPEDSSCTVGFENVEAKDAESYLEYLKSTYSKVDFLTNEGGIILFMASSDEGTVSYTYNYSDKKAVVALSYSLS